MELTINNISYHLTCHQDNPALPHLLLLHGFMGSGRAFEHLVNPLSRFVNPLTIDLLGHGQTQGTPSVERYYLERQLDDLYEIIRHLNHDRLFLHGYSMGGRLALRLALRYPGQISGLILENTNYGIENEQHRNQRLNIDEQRAQAIETDFEAFLSEWNAMPLFNKGVEIPHQLVNAYMKIQQNQNPAYIANSLRGFSTARMPSVKNKLHQLDMPTLLLAGENDNKYRKILDEMDQQIANSKFHIIRNAGHRVHLEHPRAFLDQVKAFIFSSSCNQ